MHKKNTTSLLISSLELRVHLGWPDIERQLEQIVLVDVEIWFPKPPKACTSDNLDDTLCYATLIHEIRNKIPEKTYHLIEHLTHEILRLIKPLLPAESRIHVRITKRPTIPALNGGVRFNYWDEV